MPPTLTCAIAENFTHTSAGAGLDVELSFTAGTSPVGVTIPTGTYRMGLAPSASDILRVIATAINAASAGAGHTNDVVTLTVDADGTAVYTFTGGVSGECDGVAFSTSLQRILAFASSFGPPVDNSYVVRGTRPVWYLATFAERVSADWQQRTAVASAETAGGVGYGVTSGITRWQDELTFGFIPRDPTFGTSLGVSQTPWEPDAAYLTALGTVGARAYSVSDLLSTAMGKTCAFAAGNFQAVLTSTTERYHLVTIPGRECGAPRLARLRAGWDAYRRWTTALIRQSTPTGTRA